MTGNKNNLTNIQRLALTVLAGFVSFILISCMEINSSETNDGDYIDGDMAEDGDSDLNGLISIELTPSEESGFLPQQIVDLDLNDFDGKLKIKNSVVYSGEIRPYTEAIITLVPSTNDEDFPMISGHPLPSKSTDTVSESDVNEGTLHSVFSMIVTPGTYTRYIYPKDQSLAPLSILHNGLDLNEDMTEINWIEEGIKLNGFVMDANGNPLKGISIAAYATDPWRRSSLAITGETEEFIEDGDAMQEDLNLSDGRFTIWLSEHSAIYSIVLRPESSDNLYPELTISNAIEINNGTININSEIQKDSYGRIKLYYNDFDTNPSTVSGQIRSKENLNTGIANTKIIFKSKLIGGGKFERSTVTDDTGNYSIEVLPTNSSVPNSFYTVSIQTPADSPYASLTLSNIECNDYTETIDFSLDARPVITGKITTSDETALEGIKIRATKLATETDSYVYVKTVETDANGNYSLSIDAGLYDFLFIPQEDSTLGRSYLHDVETSTDGEINQVLYEGQTFTGQVIDPAGATIPWVYVEVYKKRPGSGSYEPIGSGSTNQYGKFNIILPQLP